MLFSVITKYRLFNGHWFVSLLTVVQQNGENKQIPKTEVLWNVTDIANLKSETKHAESCEFQKVKYWPCYVKTQFLAMQCRFLTKPFFCCLSSIYKFRPIYCLRAFFTSCGLLRKSVQRQILSELEQIPISPNNECCQFCFIDCAVI